MLLTVNSLTVRYGKAVAIDDVSLDMPEGAIVGLMGANGAGKTTLLRALSGLITPSGGEIRFNGARIDGLSPAAIVARGLIHIPQNRELFPHLTVLSNLKLGASLRKDKEGIKRDLAMVFEHFPKLWERRHQKAGTLSGGEQQMATIGRGLMADPKLLLMDEPSLGLAPRMVSELVPVIKSIHQKGISVLLVEQNISLTLAVAQRGYALRVGKIVLEGGIDLFKTGDAVREAYLGR